MQMIFLQNTFSEGLDEISIISGGEAKLSTWLYKIAINECITFLNRQRNMNNVSIDDTDVFLLERLKGDDYFDGDEAQLNCRMPSSLYRRNNVWCLP